MRFIYLLHKYDWRHVTNTVIHLYTIAGLGIKPKSMIFNVCEILEVNIALICLKSLVL